MAELQIANGSVHHPPENEFDSILLALNAHVWRLADDELACDAVEVDLQHADIEAGEGIYEDLVRTRLARYPPLRGRGHYRVDCVVPVLTLRIWSCIKLTAVINSLRRSCESLLGVSLSKVAAR